MATTKRKGAAGAAPAPTQAPSLPPSDQGGIPSGLRPIHPGELLREDVMPALGRSVTEIAKLLGVSRKTLYAIMNEDAPVSPAMALKLGKLCGNGPTIWLGLQQDYDLARQARILASELEAIPTLESAA